MLRLRNCQVAILFRKLPHSACSKSLYAGEGIWRRDARIGLVAESSMNCQLANADRWRLSVQKSRRELGSSTSFGVLAFKLVILPGTIGALLQSVHRCQVAMTRY